MGVVLCLELKAFVKVCSPHQMKRGKLQYENVPSNKQSPIVRCFELKNISLKELLIKEPIYPILFDPEDS